MQIAPTRLDDPAARRPLAGTPATVMTCGLMDPGLVKTIARALRAAHYHIVLRDRDGGFAREAVETLIASTAPTERLSFTRVRVEAEAAAKQSRVTHYSRTHLPMALHTDSAHASRPHTLVAFHMIRPDPHGGGRSMVVPVLDILNRLDPADVRSLREPRFDFGKGPVPIVWGQPADPSMRYYRAQIDASAADGVPLARADAALLDRLDAVLDALAPSCAFDLRSGDLLLINNHKALHARTGFDGSSDRLMLRYRLRVGAFE